MSLPNRIFRLSNGESEPDGIQQIMRECLPLLREPSSCLAALVCCLAWRLFTLVLRSSRLPLNLAPEDRIHVYEMRLFRDDDCLSELPCDLPVASYPARGRRMGLLEEQCFQARGESSEVHGM